MKPITYHIPSSRIRSREFHPQDEEGQACRKGKLKSVNLMEPEVFVARRLTAAKHERFCKRCSSLADLVCRVQGYIDKSKKNA